MVQMPEKAMEVVEAVKHPVVQLDNAIHKARDTIIGSGSIKEEISKLGDRYLNIPKNIVGTPLKTLGDLLTLHPLKATGDLIGGGVQLFKDSFSIATAPSRLAVAGAKATGETASEVVKLPFKGAELAIKSPFLVWNTLDKGVQKATELKSSLLNTATQKASEIISAGKQ